MAIFMSSPSCRGVPLSSRIRTSPVMLASITRVSSLPALPATMSGAWLKTTVACWLVIVLRAWLRWSRQISANGLKSRRLRLSSGVYS